MQRCSVVIRRSWQSVQTYFVLFSEASKEDLHDLSPDMSITPPRSLKAIHFQASRSLKLFHLSQFSDTLFDIFIFCPKIQLWFREKSVDFFGGKPRENVMVLDLLAVDKFDSTRKIIKKILGENLVKMLGPCQNWFFGQKFDFKGSVLRCVRVK